MADRDSGQRSRQIKRILRLIAFVAVILLAAAGTLFLVRNFDALVHIFTSPDPAAEMDRFLDGNHLSGVLILFGVQIVQILLAFIPGGPMQMVAGALYGGLGGGLILLAGAAVASFLIWQLVSKLGQAAIEAFHNREDAGKLSRIKAFRDPKKAEMLVWILFLIPGVPKDLLTYFAPLTPLKCRRFIVISTIARCPGIFMTTFASSSLLSGDWWFAAGLYLLMFGAAAFGGWFYRRLHRDGDAQDADGDGTKMETAAHDDFGKD